MKSLAGLSIALGLSIWAGAGAAGCDGAPEPCQLPNGTYHFVLPPDSAGPVPAVMFLHGYGGDGLGTLSNKGMVDVMLQRGYAVIAPDGQPREGRSGRSWDFYPNRPAKRDETVFLIAGGKGCCRQVRP